MELFIPSSVVPIGGRSQPWFGRSCKTALRSKQECYQAWAVASVTRDVNTSTLKKKYNFASRSFKRVIAKAKSEHIGRIGEKLVRLPSGTRAFWSLAKAVQGNFLKRRKQATKQAQSWYCFLCKEDRVADMRFCKCCGVYVHEECVGLTAEDKKRYMCPKCEN
ncbi:unnamed protein product [Parnassius mnemosyne]|uniref:PHD-type domain-containing protein n=1 Tax=Parnassius mnemosyne TaxID=213953 RepID=A0AAV1M906_9NEOP